MTGETARLAHPPLASESAAAITVVRAPARGRGVLVVFAIWTVWGLWSINQRALAAILTGTPAPERANPWQLTMASAWFWALATLAIMGVARRIRDRIGTTEGRLLAHAGAFAGLHVIDVTVYRVAAGFMGAEPRPFLSLLVSLLTFNALIYIAVAFATTALDAAATLRARATREARLEAQLSLARFHTLRAQLQPHFLFNALNGISSLMHTDVERADRMLVRISELLRAAIESAPLPEVPIGEELAFVARYLEIEKMRYGDRLDVILDVPADLSGLLVPNMLLQPLLENAVRNGVAPHARQGVVHLRIRRQADELEITVRDSGAGFGAETPDGAGLRITRERLASLYGSRERLAFSTDADGFEARVTLPCRLAATSHAPLPR
ncbi:MAG TPA: histidine kinase [Gemmatimonadales bacterium]|nr:histidine kinase [Gemmatimonadales bacterium]